MQAWSPLSFTPLSAEAWHLEDRAYLAGLNLAQLWSQKPRAPHQSSAGTTSRRCRPRSGTSVGRPQPCSCPGSSPPPAGARRVWRTPLEPTSALGCISAMACQGHQGSPSSSWPLRDVSSNGNSPPRMGERGVPVTHSKEPSLLATLYSERSVSSPGSRILPAWPQSQRRLRDARKGRAGQVPTLHPRGGCDSNEFPEKYRIWKHPPGCPLKPTAKHWAS